MIVEIILFTGVTIFCDPEMPESRCITQKRRKRRRTTARVPESVPETCYRTGVPKQMDPTLSVEIEISSGSPDGTNYPDISARRPSVPVDRNFPTSQFSDIDPGTRNVSRPIEHFVCRHNNSDKGKLEAYSEENIPTAFRSVGPYLYLEYLAFPDFLSTDRMKISGGPRPDEKLGNPPV